MVNAITITMMKYYYWMWYVICVINVKTIKAKYLEKLKYLFYK